jgi:TRAP-type C4-dicarboxylate transport system permease small subunit
MTFKKIDLALQWGEKSLVVISWIATLFVTFMIVTDILLRFFFNLPLPASWEMSEVIMPYIVMFGFAYTLTIGVHVRVSLVVDRLPPKVQLVCDKFRNILSFAMCLLLTYWSWLRFWESFLIDEEILAAIQIPWWFGKLGMPIAFAMFATRYLTLFIAKSMQKQR